MYRFKFTPIRLLSYGGYLLLSNIVVALALGALTLSCAADEHIHAQEEEILGTDARPQIIKVSPRGPTPARLTMQRSDSVVFFYNTTDDELLTLEIDFGPRSVHCSGALRVVKSPGLNRTRKPFGPKEFVSTCFHEKGSYPYKIFSSRANNPAYLGSVIVE